MKRWILPVAFCLVSCNNDLNHAVTDIEIITPRPFAYTIGDEMVHQIKVSTHHGVILNKASLPTQGVRNRWLNINQVQVNDVVSGDTHQYEINLRYQVFYAAQTVKTLEIPSFTLSFSQGSESVEHTIPAWSFTLSPLHELELRKDNQAFDLRPSVPAPFLSAKQPPELLLLNGVVFLTSGFYLAFVYGYITLPKRRIFKRAEQQLAKVSEHNLAQGFNTLHQALNSLYGKPLFAQHLNDFYQKHTAYQAADKLLNDFFLSSNQYFFTAEPLDKTRTWQLLKQCCQHCADIERGLR